MGLFDYVRFAHNCPNCETLVTNFQSKDHACEMERIKPTQCRHFYALCRGCRAWIEFTRPRGKRKWRRSVSLYDHFPHYDKKFSKKYLRKHTTRKP